MKNIDKNKCINCVEYNRCKENTGSLVFFIIGLIAIIAVRAVTILEHVKPIYGKMAWYVGIIGFFIYFGYKYKIESNRSRLIKNSKLVDKVLKGDRIEKEDREMIGAVLCALSSSKDRINYFIIFASSAVVLVIAFYLDFLK
jgi:hypothetical protein